MWPIELHAQVVHHPLAGVFHDHRLGEIEEEVQDHQHHENRGEPRQTRQVVAAQLGQVRRREPGQVREGDAGGVPVDPGNPGVFADHRGGGRVGEVDAQVPLGRRRPRAGVRGACGRRDDVAVDGELGHIRQGQVEERDQHHQADRTRHQAAVRPGEGAQPPQQLEVVGFAQAGLFEVVLIRPHRAPSSTSWSR